MTQSPSLVPQTTKPTRVALHPLALSSWPWLPSAAPPGALFVGPTGERVRVAADGSAEEVLEVPRRWSASTDPCAGRRS